MIKSRLQAVLDQHAFPHIHVSGSTEITMEFSLVGIQGCRDGAQSDALESLVLQGGIKIRADPEDLVAATRAMGREAHRLTSRGSAFRG